MSDSSSGIPLWPILKIGSVLALATGSAWLLQLESSRPSSPNDERAAVAEPSKIPARLWQDPLQALHSHLDDHKSSAGGASDMYRYHPLESLQLEIEERRKRGSVYILIAMIRHAYKDAS